MKTPKHPRGFLILGARLLSQASIVVVTSLIIRNAGPSVFAQLAIITSISALFSISDFGIANGVVNLLTTENSITQRQHIRRSITLMSALCILSTSIILSPIGDLFIKLLSLNANQEWPAEFQQACKIGLISAVIYNFYVLQVRIFQSVNKEVQLALFMIGLSILNIIYASLASVTENTLPYLAFANSGILGFAAMLFLSAKEIRMIFSRQNLQETYQKFRTYLNSGQIFIIIQVTYLFSYQFDTVILAHFFEITQVAQFSLYFKIYTLPIIILSSLLNHVWGDSSRLFKQNDFDKLRRTLRDAFRLSFVVIIFNSIIGLTAVNTAVEFLGNGKVEISPELNIFFILMTNVFCVSVPITQFLYGVSAKQFLFVSSIALTCCNLTLSILLLQMSGSIVSTLIATILSQIFFLLIPFYFFWKKFVGRNSSL